VNGNQAPESEEPNKGVPSDGGGEQPESGPDTAADEQPTFVRKYENSLYSPDSRPLSQRFVMWLLRASAMETSPTIFLALKKLQLPSTILSHRNEGDIPEHPRNGRR
jgi:hypothetical protein